MLGLEKDFGDILYERLSLYLYERNERKMRKSQQSEKERFVKNNTVIVTVNDEVIYDSRVDGIISDDLFNALISYGVVKSTQKKKKNRRKKSTKNIYNIKPNVTSIIWNEATDKV